MIEYEIKKSARTRRMTITVKPDNTVLVTIPKIIPTIVAQEFVKLKEEWIQKVLQKNQKFQKILPPKNRIEFLKAKRPALALIKERLEYFNNFYGYKINSVKVKSQNSRWGSCSKSGNLNFNYQLIYLTPEQRDYVIVHELCHLKELNHSQRFWDLVEQTIPNYKEIRKGLKNIR